MDTFNDRFTELWYRHSPIPDAAVAITIHAKLVELYSQKWRSYHNFSHIQACLSWFDDCRNHAKNADSIEMAIWFHDCIYIVGKTDNEAQSRDFFLEQSDGILGNDFKTVVANLIMDTCHAEKPVTKDGQLLADIDLTSFGLSWEDYLFDNLNVQKESATRKSPPNPGAKTFYLEKLQSRKTVYYTPYYLEHYEASAQHNISYHLAQFRKQAQDS